MTKPVDVEIAEIKKDVKYLIKESEETNKTLADLVNEVRRGMSGFETRVNSLEKQWLRTKFKTDENSSRVKRIERLILGAVGTILLAVIAKLLGLIGL